MISNLFLFFILPSGNRKVRQHMKGKRLINICMLSGAGAEQSVVTDQAHDTDSSLQSKRKPILGGWHLVFLTTPDLANSFLILIGKTILKAIFFITLLMTIK